MKKAKKFLSLLLAMAMVMAMSLTTFAAERNPADLSTHTFTAYQIFNAETISEDNELGNLTWGSGITEEGQAALLAKYEVTTVPALAKKLAENTINAKEFATAAYEYRTDGTAVVSKTTTLPIGYYLIEDTTNPLEGDDQVYNLSILKVSDADTAIEIENKTSVPQVDKEILDPTEMKNNEAGIGEVVEYQITGTLPSNLSDYETYYYWFKDTLSKGLTYNEDLTVSIKNGNDLTDVTEYFYIHSAADGDDTVIDVAIEDIIALNLLEDVTVNANSIVVLNYTATVNEAAIIAGTGNPNKVDLEYTNNPDQSGEPTTTPPGENPPKPTKNYPTGKTPEDKVVTYVTELTIIKTDENGKIVTGAEFTLYGENLHKVVIKTTESFEVAENGAYWKLKDGTFTTDAPQAEVKEDDVVVIESNEDLYESTTVKYSPKTVVEASEDEDGDLNVSAYVDETTGKVTFTGLGAGDYKLVESVVPEGYNKAEDLVFTISYSNGTFTSSNNAVELASKANTFVTTIENRSGATLPETGGMGTRLFYLIGGLMVLCAGVLLVTKRRMSR